MDFNQKQLQILETAERLFAMHGFHGASVRDIAQGADVNIAMISYYFGSKERLIESIFLKRIMDVKSGLDELVKNKDLDPLEKMNRLIDLFIARISERPSVSSSLPRTRAECRSDKSGHAARRRPATRIQDSVCRLSYSAMFGTVESEMYPKIRASCAAGCRP